MAPIRKSLYKLLTCLYSALVLRSVLVGCLLLGLSGLLGWGSFGLDYHGPVRRRVYLSVGELVSGALIPLSVISLIIGIIVFVSASIRSEENPGESKTNERAKSARKLAFYLLVACFIVRGPYLLAVLLGQGDPFIDAWSKPVQMGAAIYCGIVDWKYFARQRKPSLA